MKRLKKNKGITLIALIITIIVMLILVGVTVSVALNGGLFSTAKKAAEKTNTAVEEEKEDAIALEIELRREELLKKYPIKDTQWTSGSDEFLILQDLSIVDLYDYILKEYYGISSQEDLTLTIAIRAVNKLNQLYDSEVKNIVSPNGNKFWNKLMDSPNIKDGDSYRDLTEEEQRKINTIVYANLFSGTLNYGMVRDESNNGEELQESRYFALRSDSVKNFKSVIESLFPAGSSIPFEKIKGETIITEGYISQILLFGAFDCIDFIKIDTNNLNEIPLYDGTKQDEEPIEATNDYIGKIACICSSLENKEDKKAILCHNVILFDRKLGYVYYIDENGVIDKELP